MPILPTHWVGTDVGIARDLNEDAFLWLGPADTEGRGWLWLVADGLGGASAGDLAAALLVTTFEDTWAETLEEKREFEPAVRAVVAAACARIAAVEAAFPALRGMSAAVAIVAFADGGFWTAHAGDCRVARVREGRVEKLTTDHLANPGAAEIAGRRSPGVGELQRLARHVGAGGVELEVRGPERAQPGDVLLLTSDGVHAVLEDVALLAAATVAPRDAVDMLVTAARDAWSDDNLTAAVVRFGPAVTSDELPPRTNVVALPGPEPSAPAAPASGAAGMPLSDPTRTLSFSPDAIRQIRAEAVAARPADHAGTPALAASPATSTLLFSRADIAALEANNTRTGLLAGRIVEAARRAAEPASVPAPRAGNGPVVGVRAAVAGVGGDLGAPRQRMEPSRPAQPGRAIERTAPLAADFDDEPQSYSVVTRPTKVAAAAAALAAIVILLVVVWRRPAPPAAPVLADDAGGHAWQDGSPPGADGSGVEASGVN